MAIRSDSREWQVEQSDAMIAKYEGQIASRESQLQQLKKSAQPTARISKLKAESDRKVTFLYLL